MTETKMAYNYGVDEAGVREMYRMYDGVDEAGIWDTSTLYCVYAGKRPFQDFFESVERDGKGLSRHNTTTNTDVTLNDCEIVEEDREIVEEDEVQLLDVITSNRDSEDDDVEIIETIQELVSDNDEVQILEVA